MTEEQYKELNAYLNETFIYLEDEFEPLITNILPIFILNDRYKDLIEKYDLDIKYKENNLSFDDVYLLTRKIIEKINPGYLKDYDNLVKSGELDFSYDGDYYDSNFTHTKDHNSVNINRTFNYSDIRLLTHEYIHYTNGKDRCTYNQYLLTEFFSIYFELYAIDYLIDKGIPQDEIDYTRRLSSTYNRVKNIYYIEIPLLAYSKFGSLDKHSYKMLRDFYASKLTEERFNDECEALLNWFKDAEKSYKKRTFKCDYNTFDLRQYYSEMVEYYFLYFIGTIFAFYAIDNCNVNDIVYMNDHINDSEFSFFDCLEKMKINVFDDDFDDKVIESIEKHLTKHKIKSR